MESAAKGTDTRLNRLGDGQTEHTSWEGRTGAAVGDDGGAEAHAGVACELGQELGRHGNVGVQRVVRSEPARTTKSTSNMWNSIFLFKTTPMTR